MSRGKRWVGAAVAALVFAAELVAAPAAEAPRPDKAAQATLRFLPKSRRMSTYTLGARFEVTTKEITFDAPAAYQSGFDFWASRMKGQRQSEVCDMITITQDAGENGEVAFRRTVPRYDIELLKHGQVYAPGVGLSKIVTTLAWEGSLDPFGNVKEMKKVAGDDNAEVGTLAIPEMSRLFPEATGPRDLKVGEGFKEERSVRLPTKLAIAGLENVTILWTREYTLKSVSDGLATFDVKVAYAADPAFKPEMERTTCKVSGGGTGDAVFEVKRGVFLRSRQQTSMSIDIEAPLRPLPDQPATDAPPVGKSHIEIDLLLTGEQTVKRVWGEDKD